MLDMLDNWTIATNGNRVTVRIIMFDLRKAFDRIDHRILTDKSRSLNLAVSVVNWIMNFFSDQYQRVKLCEGCTSEWGLVPSCVLQGTKAWSLASYPCYQLLNSSQCKPMEICRRHNSI